MSYVIKTNNSYLSTYGAEEALPHLGITPVHFSNLNEAKEVAQALNTLSKYTQYSQQFEIYNFSEEKYVPKKKASHTVEIEA